MTSAAWIDKRMFQCLATQNFEFVSRNERGRRRWKGGRLVEEEVVVSRDYRGTFHSGDSTGARLNPAFHQGPSVVGRSFLCSSIECTRNPSCLSGHGLFFLLSVFFSPFAASFSFLHCSHGRSVDFLLTAATILLTIKSAKRHACN